MFRQAILQRHFVHAELKQVWPRIMASHIEIELAAHDLGRIDLSRNNRFFVVVRSRQQLAERRNDTASAANEYLIGVIAQSARVISRAVAPAQELARGKHKTATFASNVLHRGNPAI